MAELISKVNKSKSIETDDERKILREVQKSKYKTEMKKEKCCQHRNKTKTQSAEKHASQAKWGAEKNCPSSALAVVGTIEDKDKDKCNQEKDNQEVNGKSPGILDTTDVEKFACVHSNKENRTGHTGSAFEEPDIVEREHSENHQLQKGNPIAHNDGIKPKSGRENESFEFIDILLMTWHDNQPSKDENHFDLLLKQTFDDLNKCPLADFVQICQSFRRRTHALVYAAKYDGGKEFLCIFDNKQVIKYILQTQNLRIQYLEYEHFRLATLSLSTHPFEMGEMLRLAASGFFCDADGNIKCFRCGQIYTCVTNFSNSHDPECVLLYPNGPIRRSIAENYGEYAISRLVPSGEAVHEENRSQAFTSIDIQYEIRISTLSFMLGRTSLLTEDDTQAQNSEQSENSEDISIRDVSSNSRQGQEKGPKAIVSLLANTGRHTGVGHENKPTRTAFSGNGFEGNHSRNVTTNDVCKSSRQGPPRDAGIVESMQGNGFRHMDSEEQHRQPEKPFLWNGFEDVVFMKLAMAIIFMTKALAIIVMQLTQTRSVQPRGSRHRTIKEDVNRRDKGDKLLLENKHMKAKTRCIICKRRQRSIVFVPCGHLVVCNKCIKNTLICPVCREKVDEAIEANENG